VTDNTGPRTTTIARPRPNFEEARRKRGEPSGIRGADLRLLDRRSSRIVLGLMAAVIAGALAASMLILPVKAWLNQREELSHRETELAQLAEANARLEADVARLETDQGITAAIREELGAVHENEKVFRIVLDPDLLQILPEGWLYPTISTIMQARAGLNLAPIVDPILNEIPLAEPTITGAPPAASSP